MILVTPLFLIGSASHNHRTLVKGYHESFKHRLKFKKEEIAMSKNMNITVQKVGMKYYDYEKLTSGDQVMNPLVTVLYLEHNPYDAEIIRPILKSEERKAICDNLCTKRTRKVKDGS